MLWEAYTAGLRAAEPFDMVYKRIHVEPFQKDNDTWFNIYVDADTAHTHLNVGTTDISPFSGSQESNPTHRLHYILPPYGRICIIGGGKAAIPMAAAAEHALSPISSFPQLPSLSAHNSKLTKLSDHLGRVCGSMVYKDDVCIDDAHHEAHSPSSNHLRCIRLCPGTHPIPSELSASATAVQLQLVHDAVVTTASDKTAYTHARTHTEPPPASSPASSVHGDVATSGPVRGVEVELLFLCLLSGGGSALLTAPSASLIRAVESTNAASLEPRVTEKVVAAVAHAGDAADTPTEAVHNHTGALHGQIAATNKQALVSEGQDASASWSPISQSPVTVAVPTSASTVSPPYAPVSTVPTPVTPLQCLQQLGKALLASGAPIQDINAVRGQVDAVKAGGLGRTCVDACVKLGLRVGIHTLALSDVLGDDLRVIASGPTVYTPITGKTASAVSSDGNCGGDLMRSGGSVGSGHVGVDTEIGATAGAEDVASGAVCAGTGTGTPTVSTGLRGGTAAPAISTIVTGPTTGSIADSCASPCAALAALALCRRWRVPEIMRAQSSDGARCWSILEEAILSNKRVAVRGGAGEGHGGAMAKDMSFAGTGGGDARATKTGVSVRVVGVYVSNCACVIGSNALSVQAAAECVQSHGAVLVESDDDGDGNEDGGCDDDKKDDEHAATREDGKSAYSDSKDGGGAKSRGHQTGRHTVAPIRRRRCVEGEASDRASDMWEDALVRVGAWCEGDRTPVIVGAAMNKQQDAAMREEGVQGSTGQTHRVERQRVLAYVRGGELTVTLAPNPRFNDLYPDPTSPGASESGCGHSVGDKSTTGGDAVGAAFAEKDTDITSTTAHPLVTNEREHFNQPQTMLRRYQAVRRRCAAVICAAAHSPEAHRPQDPNGGRCQEAALAWAVRCLHYMHSSLAANADAVHKRMRIMTDDDALVHADVRRAPGVSDTKFHQQHCLLLSAWRAVVLRGYTLSALFAGTDGSDGPNDAAGGFVSVDGLWLLCFRVLARADAHIDALVTGEANTTAGADRDGGDWEASIGATSGNANAGLLHTRSSDEHCEEDAEDVVVPVLGCLHALWQWAADALCKHTSYHWLHAAERLCRVDDGTPNKRMCPRQVASERVLSDARELLNTRVRNETGVLTSSLTNGMRSRSASGCRMSAEEVGIRHIFTGPTGTNVNDVYMWCAERRESL